MTHCSRKLISTTLAGLFAPASSAWAQTAPDDTQIAGIVVAANQVDIDAGKLAQKMTK